MTTVTFPNSLTNLGDQAFGNCSNLTTITIPGSVANIGVQAFEDCASLNAVYFMGNAPSLGSSAFYRDNNATLFYLPGATNWASTFGGRPAVLWNPQPKTGSLGLRANQLGFNITGSSNLVVVIEASTDLTNPTWSPLQTNTLGGGPLYFSDPNWTKYPSRFYRVTWP